MECGEMRDYMVSNTGNLTSRKFKSIVICVVSFALVLGFVGFAVPRFLSQTAAAITQPNYAAFDGVGITPVGTNYYTISSDITATDIGNNTVKLTGDAPIVTPWFGQDWTTYNYVTVGIHLPEGFMGNYVYQSGIMRYDDPAQPEGYYKMGKTGSGSTALATTGSALGYLDYSFAANSINTKKEGLVKLSVTWKEGDNPEIFTINISGLHLLTAAETAVPRVAITSPTLNQAISGRTVTIKGTATDTDFNYYYCYVSNVNGHEYGTRDASCNTTWHAVAVAGTLGTVTLPNDLPDGNYVAHLIAYDKAGNSKETTQPFMLDNTLPVQPVFTAPVNDLFTKTNFVTLTWANGDDSGLNQSGIKGYTIRYTFVPMDGGATVEWTSGIITNGNPKTHSGTYGHGQGMYTMYVSTVDNAGNVSLESNPLVLSYDATVPVAAITTPTVATVSGHILNIEGTATDANFNYYYCYVTNANGEVGIRDPQCVTAWSADSLFHSAFAATVTGTTAGHLGTVDLTGLSSGTYQVHILAYDKAGNSTEATQQFILDNTPPEVTINSHGNIASGLPVTFTGTIDDPTSTLKLMVGDMSFTPSIDEVTKTWSYVMNTTTLNAGTYTAVITAIDAAGNESIPSQTTQTNLIVNPFIAPADGGVSQITRSPILTPNTNPILVADNNTQQATPGNSQDAQAVLGSTTKKDNNGSLDKVAALAATDNGWSIFGLMWYWWALIAAAIASAWWVISAAIRRRGQGLQ